MVTFQYSKILIQDSILKHLRSSQIRLKNIHSNLVCSFVNLSRIHSPRLLLLNILDF